MIGVSINTELILYQCDTCVIGEWKKKLRYHNKLTSSHITYLSPTSSIFFIFIYFCFYFIIIIILNDFIMIFYFLFWKILYALHNLKKNLAPILIDHRCTPKYLKSWIHDGYIEFGKNHDRWDSYFTLSYEIYG